MLREEAEKILSTLSVFEAGEQTARKRKPHTSGASIAKAEVTEKSRPQFFADGLQPNANYMRVTIEEKTSFPVEKFGKFTPAKSETKFTQPEKCEWISHEKALSTRNLFEEKKGNEFFSGLADISRDANFSGRARDKARKRLTLLKTLEQVERAKEKARAKQSAYGYSSSGSSSGRRSAADRAKEYKYKTAGFLIMAFFLTFIILFVTLSKCSSTPKSGTNDVNISSEGSDFVFTELEGGGVSVSVKRYGKGAYFPSEYNGKPVVTIERPVYSTDNDKLIDAVIPDTVKTISDKAFYGCTSLVRIDLSSVETIEQMAFGDCTSLKSLVIPSSVKSMAHFAFLRCTALEYLTIESEETSMTNLTFNGCNKIKELSAPASLLYCIPSQKLVSVDVNGGERLEHYEFMNCATLEEITLPDTLKYVGENSFYGCVSLGFIGVPEGVESIGKSAFSECVSLYMIRLPSTLGSIGENAFYACEALAEIYYDGTAEQWEQIEKHEKWDFGLNSYTVVCSDIRITK